MIPTKIVIIGAGSASFGLQTLGSLMGSQVLHGSRIALVDRDADTLALVRRLAKRLNREWNARMKITSHTHHRDALDGAGFVVSAIEVPPRERLWRSDFEIPLKYGLRQPYAENGGPGGFAHAARNIGPVLDIVHDMEAACPYAWFINFSNPMSRICDAISRYSKIKTIGLCHQINAGYAIVGYVLADYLDIKVPPGEISTHADPKYWDNLGVIYRQALQKVDIKAAGLNHFTWMLDIHDRRSGDDLYPLFRERWASFDPSFEPLTRQVFHAFGLLPIPGDEHLCEYLPWVSDPQTRPWEKYDISLYDWDLAEANRAKGHIEIAAMGNGEKSIDALRDVDSEGTLEVVENIASAGNHYHLAVNLPNRGYIANLPEGAIVEVPGIFSAAGAAGVAVGALPQGITELCRREITSTQLCVDAVVNGDRQTALQSLLLSPGITDLDVARHILDDYLETYRDHLPAFW
ncbi:MAG: hypothetical protein MUO76_01330 [Anaerolineaceae bacterium]|nr:hypothetical protein [Anaerolineaceae bacterium]